MRTHNPRCVLDTNVLIRAALSNKGAANQAVSQTIRHGMLLASEATFGELKSRLHRSRFGKYLTLDEIAGFLYLEIASYFVPIHSVIAFCRDPGDDKFLELALDGRADCIVSTDQDLLVMHPFQDIPILTPERFLHEMRGG